MNFAAILTSELERRQQLNRRYSLRAFARTLGISHTLLSRLRHGRHRPAPSTIATIGARLGLSAVNIHEVTRREQVERLCAWTARPGFQANARWLAVRLGLSLDEVQLALHEALYQRRLTMREQHVWTEEA